MFNRNYISLYKYISLVSSMCDQILVFYSEIKILPLFDRSTEMNASTHCQVPLRKYFGKNSGPE